MPHQSTSKATRLQSLLRAHSDEKKKAVTSKKYRQDFARFNNTFARLMGTSSEA